MSAEIKLEPHQIEAIKNRFSEHFPIEAIAEAVLKELNNPTPPSLSQCPFCGNSVLGNKPIRVLPSDVDYMVYCPKCETHGPIGSSETSAILAWNRRV